MPCKALTVIFLQVPLQTLLAMALERTLLQNLDDYLSSPFPDEIDEIVWKTLQFPTVNGEDMTLADCNLLPKLHIVKVVTTKYKNFDIPESMTGIWRYLSNAYCSDEFTNTCPGDREIEIAYADVAKRLTK